MDGVKCIAIVDDDEENRQVIDKHLSAYPEYTTKLLSSGKELIEFLKINKADLILLDIEMPEISGIETYDRLKTIGLKSVPPVIFLTGKEDRDTVLRCIGKGADGYIIKPVDREALVSRIEEVLEKYDKYKTNKTVLMIDDDAEFLKVAKTKLSKYYKILTVNSGKSALEYLSTHSVDLIILDYFMPLYDGKNILAILRKRTRTQNTPVIIASALSNEEVFKACSQCPPDDIITKPIKMDDLLNMIQKVLRK